MNIFHTIIGANGEAFHFEFDQAKSAANKLKHGIDFVEVQRLWLDAALVEIPLAVTMRRAGWWWE